MSWSITLRPGDTLTINGARLSVDGTTRLKLHDQAHVILPDGRVFEPKIENDEIQKDSPGALPTL